MALRTPLQKKFEKGKKEEELWIELGIVFQGRCV